MRVRPSSHFPIKFLSPASQDERRSLISKDRKCLQRQVPGDVLVFCVRLFSCALICVTMYIGTTVERI